VSLKEEPPARSGGKLYLHASAVIIGEDGVLICGPAGAGKSSLAFALIAAAEAAGMFARLVGDDRIEVELRGGRLIARGHPLIFGKIERRGQGIFEMPALPAAIVRLIITLMGADEMPPRFPEADHLHTVLAGARLPLMTLRQDAAAANCAFAILASLRLRRIHP
jgi:HPr kinase/phosphorylase